MPRMRNMSLCACSLRSRITKQYLQAHKNVMLT